MEELTAYHTDDGSATGGSTSVLGCSHGGRHMSPLYSTPSHDGVHDAIQGNQQTLDLQPTPATQHNRVAIISVPQNTLGLQSSMLKLDELSPRKPDALLPAYSVCLHGYVLGV